MTNTDSTSRRWRRQTLWGLMAVAAVGIAGYTVSTYLAGGPALSIVPLDPDVTLHYLSVAVHAVPGGLALAIGPLQFITALRARRPRLHRILGKIYMASVIAASAAALFSAAVSLSGFALQVAFYLITALWLYTLAQAFLNIRRGEITMHRIWMIRNYALTFTAVTLRVYLITGLQLFPLTPELTFKDIYTASGWASLIGNVIVAEYFIIQRILLRPPHRRRPRSATPAPQPTIHN
ncbi:Uncharacterized membrane protein [Sinosporangium album]|uniref:Uncharacterized membrane protein n=1 Tax=Sinosporangium album TaxID=504805 RepID=A0A1G7YP94_9ACTN|nr:DUF2306 domain-containing protein [Sinosporangium album]SDG98049.1 Uncharacterized membrane protein [Sinosporangium album]